MKVEIVDKTMQRDPMKIGIGTPLQADALTECGAETIIYTHKLPDLTDEDGDNQLFAAAFRPGDVVVLVQPNLLGLRDMKAITDQGAVFEIPGVGVVTPSNDKERRFMRKLKPKGIEAPRLEKRGGKVLYPQPTEEQARAIVELWHSPMRLSLACDQVRGMMGARFENSWVRDRVKKYTGSAARSPEADGKHPFKFIE